MRVSGYRWVIEVVLFLVYMCFGISWLAFAPLLPEMEKHFAIAHTQAGLLVSIVSVAKAFVPLLAGLLASRIGLRRSLLLGASLCGLAVLSPLAPSFQWLAALRFAFGVGGAIVVTLMGATVMAWFPRNELPMVNGLNNVAVNSGICVALFATVPLASRLGWSSTLAAYGCLSIVLAVAWAVFGRDVPGTAPSPAAAPRLLGEVLRRRETWLIAVGFTGPLCLYLALNTWLPTYYHAAFGLSRATASATTGLFNLVGIPAAILGGWLTARLGLRRPLLMVSGLLMPLAAIGLVTTPDATLRAVCAALLGAAFFLYVSPLFTIPMELPGLDARHVALLNGVVYSTAYLVSFLSPMAVGWIQDHQGSCLPGFILFALLSSVLALAGWLLPETGPRAAARRAVSEDVRPVWWRSSATT